MLVFRSLVSLLHPSLLTSFPQSLGSALPPNMERLVGASSLCRQADFCGAGESVGRTSHPTLSQPQQLRHIASLTH